MFKLAAGKAGDRAPLTEAQIGRLPELIDEATAVFVNPDGRGLTVVTAIIDSAGSPVIVGLQPNRAERYVQVNIVATAFGQNNSQEKLGKLADGQWLAFAGEKQNPRLSLSSLVKRQTDAGKAEGSKRTVLGADDLRKFREQQRSKASNNPAPGWDVAETATDQLSQAAVDREVAKAQAEFDGVTIEVMDSIQDAPTSDRTKRLYPGANGLTDGASRVWIFRRGMQSLQQLRTTLAHEIIGHIGVERVIGADWPAVVDAIKRIRAGSTLASPAVDLTSFVCRPNPQRNSGHTINVRGALHVTRLNRFVEMLTARLAR